MNVAEVIRSIELYNLGKSLQNTKEKTLAFTKEPFLRKRNKINNLVVAFGSYDPLTIAHEALFLKGLSAVKEKNSLDEILIVTSTEHWNKEIDWRKNSALYDRVHSLESFAGCYGNVSLALFNDPLFVHLGKEIKNHYLINNIHFLVGSDVLEQIVNPEGYKQRNLDIDLIYNELFQYNYIVCEREMENELIDLTFLKEKYPILKENEDKLISIDIRDDYKKLSIPIQQVSSTIIRNKRSHNQAAFNLEAVGISDFVDRRGIYLNDDLKYAAFVCARQRFADNNENKPIASYINQLMGYLSRLQTDKDLQIKEIKPFF